MTFFISGLPLKVVAVTGLLAIAGCMVGPDYQPPVIDMPIQYLEPAATDASIANLSWWELFNDDTLESLIEEALANNQDLAAAVSRIEEAAAILGVTRANQYPTLDVEGSASRFSRSEALYPGSSEEENYVLNGAASFELDLWGKLRRSTQAARAELLASEANARNVTISLIAATANTYFQLLDLDERLKISTRTLQSREASLNIIQARYHRGIVPELDVNQADIEAADAQATAMSLERAVRQSANALSVLVGSPPRVIVRGLELSKQVLPLEVPSGLPMELLERRPDIFIAEQQLAAETARIGVARAGRLPSIALTGSFGYASADVDDLLESNSESWNVLGGIFTPIFNAGKLKSLEEAQRQRAEQALQLYQQAVHNGLRDVDDSLTAVRTYRAEHQARQRQLAAASNAARLSRARYDGGVANYLEVLDSERSLFEAELLVSQTLQFQLNAVVNLYRSLGGGWPAAEEQDNKKD